MTVWDLTSPEVLPCKTISQKNFEIDSIAVFGSLLASIEYGPCKNQEFEATRDAFQVQIYDMSNHAKYSHSDTNSLFKYSLGEDKGSGSNQKTDA
jgi:hypothetical protein